MHALFIGRFQPFHLGHLSVIKLHIIPYTHLFIGVGSSQYHHTKENPFSFEERKTMMTQVFKDENIKNVDIIAIPDIHDPPHWVDHVLDCIDDFTDVFTNNDFTAHLFQEKGFTVHMPGFYEKHHYSGKEIRNKMKHKKPWKHLVHPAVYFYLTRIDAEKRIQQLHK